MEHEVSSKSYFSKDNNVDTRSVKVPKKKVASISSRDWISLTTKHVKNCDMNLVVLRTWRGCPVVAISLAGDLCENLRTTPDLCLVG